MIRFRWSSRILAFLIPWLCPGPQVLGVQIRQLTRQETIDNHPVFSPSGREILFASNRAGTVALMRIPVDGGEPTQVPIGLTGDLYSDWHPDGQSIVFDARGARGPPDVYRYWMESGELQQLTHDSGMDGQPAFSPDGREIVFMSMRGGSRDLWIMDADGENQRQLTSEPGGEWHPRWSPDGQGILFSSDRDGDVDIWIIGVDGTGLRKLTSRPGVEDRGAWSPDGSRVGFQWEGDLWMVSSLGGDPEQLTDFPGSEGNLTWSPDGNSIVFAADISGNINLWLLSVGEGSWPDPNSSSRHRF